MAYGILGDMTGSPLGLLGAYSGYSGGRPQVMQDFPGMGQPGWSMGGAPASPAPAVPPQPQPDPAAPPPVSGGLGGWMRSNPDFISALGGSLLSGGTMRQGLANFGQVAPQIMQQQRKRGALNAWLKAKSSGDKAALDQATQDLYQADPSIAENVASYQLVPHREWKQIGTSPYGQPQFGWVDAGAGTATPATGGAGSGGGDLPPVTFDAKGQPDQAAQDQFLKGIDPGIGNLVKGIAEYTIDPTKSLPIRGGNREYVLGLVRQYDPSYDMTQYGVRSHMRQLMESGGMYGQAIDSINQAIQHLDSLSESYKGLNNSAYPSINSVSNAWKYQTGDEKFQAQAGSFNRAADALSGELAKVFKGQGATAEQEIVEWRKGLNPNMPPADFNASVHTMIGHLLKARLDNIRSDYENAMHKPLTFDPIKPATKLTLQKLGIDSSALESDTAPPDDTGAPPPDAPPPPQPAGKATPPAGAVAALKQYPEKAAEFDLKYGPGAAAQILGQ